MERFYLNAQQNAIPAEAWAEAGEKPCRSVGAECLASTGGGGSMAGEASAANASSY